MIHWIIIVFCNHATKVNSIYIETENKYMALARRSLAIHRESVEVVGRGSAWQLPYPVQVEATTTFRPGSPSHTPTETQTAVPELDVAVSF